MLVCSLANRNRIDAASVSDHCRLVVDNRVRVVKLVRLPLPLPPASRQPPSDQYSIVVASTLLHVRRTCGGRVLTAAVCPSVCTCVNLLQRSLVNADMSCYLWLVNAVSCRLPRHANISSIQVSYKYHISRSFRLCTSLPPCSSPPTVFGRILVYLLKLLFCHIWAIIWSAARGSIAITVAASYSFLHCTVIEHSTGLKFKPPSVLWHGWLGHQTCKSIVFEITS